VIYKCACDETEEDVAKPKTLEQGVADAAEFVDTQKGSANWIMLPGTKPIEFAAIRDGLCRWPLGEPRDFETFRFCGATCDGDATYCPGHAARATSQTSNRDRARGLAYLTKGA
jgi:hypothetical protein